MATITDPGALSDEGWSRGGLGRPFPHRVARSLGVTALTLAAAAVVVALGPSAFDRALGMGEQLLRWLLSLGAPAVVVALGLLVAGLVVVAVATEREFSRTDDWYDGR